jgi:branched-subunit amino acid transport protein
MALWALRPEFVWLVLACAMVTVLPRVLPLVLLSRFALPAWLRTWLAYVPPAVLAALLAIEVVLVDGQPAFEGNPALLAIAPALAAATLTRSLIATVLAGVGAFWLLV